MAWLTCKLKLIFAFWIDYQDLIDKASAILVRNRNLVQRMQVSLDIPVANESEDASFANFKQVLC